MAPQELINFDWFLISTLKFIKRYTLLLSILFVLGGIVGFTFASVKQPVYESQLIGYSSLISGDRIQEIIFDLGENIRKRNFNSLSQKMSMPVAELSNIKSLGCEIIKDANVEKEVDYINFSDNCVLVVVETNSIESIEHLQQGLINYINQNEFIQQTLKTRMATLNELYKETDNEIKKLDELQSSIVEAVKEGNDLFYLADKSFSHFEKISLLKERKKIQEQIAFLSPLIVILPFTVPENPKLLTVTFTIISAMMFVILGVIGASVREVNARILS